MIVRNIPRHFVAPLSERGGCRVIPAQIVLFVAIADNHNNLRKFAFNSWQFSFQINQLLEAAISQNEQLEISPKE